MVTRRRYLANRGFPLYAESQETTHFKRIDRCFVRKEHSCGKYLGVSKSCFIACPSTNEVKMLTELISEKLTKNGIEPIIAIDIRAYGQDIFCTKICGKIIEAQFCIAILDDNATNLKSGKLNIPNPNVYYEYGIMTSLGKYVIPLQKEGDDLAFNIKTHDTIRYSPGDVSAEIDKALITAIKVTVEERESSMADIIPDYMYRSFLAVHGYHQQGYSWLLSDDIEGTMFSGFKSDKTGDFLFFTAVDDKDMLKTCIIDIQVIQRRLNNDCAKLAERISSADKKIPELQEKVGSNPPVEESSYVMMLDPSYNTRNALNNAIAKKTEDLTKLQSIKNSKFGVVLNPDLVELKEKCLDQLVSADIGPIKFPVYLGDTSGINIGDIEVKFKSPEL